MDYNAQREKWTRYASVYDKRRFALMPGYSEMLHAVVEALPFSKDDSFRVLDVGTGTGNLAELILSRFPNVRVTGIDISDGMLEVAKERLERFEARAHLEQADIEVTPLTGTWEAVVSSLTFRCLSPERKGTFLPEVKETLVKGGTTIHADVLLLSNGYVNEQNGRVWDHRKHHALAQGLITQEELLQEEQRRKEYETGARKQIDGFVSYEQFVSYFRHSGFPDADAIWRYWGLAVVAGQKT